jgi:hypothetical protein
MVLCVKFVSRIIVHIGRLIPRQFIPTSLKAAIELSQKRDDTASFSFAYINVSLYMFEGNINNPHFNPPHLVVPTKLNDHLLSRCEIFEKLLMRLQYLRQPNQH